MNELATKFQKIAGVRECILVSRDGFVQEQTMSGTDMCGASAAFIGEAGCQLGELLKLGALHSAVVVTKEHTRILVLRHEDLYITLLLELQGSPVLVENSVREILTRE